MFPLASTGPRIQFRWAWLVPRERVYKMTGNGEHNRRYGTQSSHCTGYQVGSRVEREECYHTKAI